MSSNPAAASNNFPFMYFGHRLWRLREKRGMRTTEVANFLNIPANDYRKYEAGEKIPDPRLLLDLSRILKIDLARLRQWEQYAKRKLEDQPLKGALSHTKALSEAIERVKKTYFEMMDIQADNDVIEILTNLQKDVSRILTLPILPMNLLMIMNVLEEKGHKVRYLHEIGNFMMEQESFSGFLSRDAYLGAFVFFAANTIYFSKSPCQNITDCFNRLTIDQFTELLFIAVDKYGFYDADQEIPQLQQQAEFTSVATLMARELESCLPKSIDFNHLHMALLLQGIGIHVLFSILQPSLKVAHQKKPTKMGGVYSTLDETLFDAIVYEVHPVISAMMAANWNFPVEVQNILATHHERESAKVSPVCAILKIINFFTDNDFPAFTKDDLIDVMNRYPQVQVPLESFYQVCVKLNGMKEKLAERSSNLAEQASQDVSDYSNDRITKFKNNPAQALREGYRASPRRTDFRFDPGYQKALVNSCQAQLHRFNHDVTSLKKDESLEDYGTRMQNMQLRCDLVHSQDQLSTAQKFKVSVDALKIRLGLP